MSSSSEEQVKKTKKKKAKCSCKGYNLDKLLQPNILILLWNDHRHGYSIIQALEKSDFFYGEKIDPAGIYRTLKKMEEKALVESRWEGLEAPKRVYRITAEGEKCLENWIFTLEAYQKTIDQIINEAKICLTQKKERDSGERIN